MRIIILLSTAIFWIAASARGSEAQEKAAQVTQPNIASQTTFLYYKAKDMAAGEHFYGTVMGLKKTLDQGWFKTYQLTQASFVGLVDEGRGYHQAPKSTPAVMLSLETKDLDGWYRQLKARQAKFLKALDANDGRPLAQPILMKDPAGYTVEIWKRTP